MTDDLVKRLRSVAKFSDLGLCPIAADRIEQLVATNEALTEQLEAARADAKEAEAYAEELGKEIELNEQEACMMEEDLFRIDKKVEELEAKLSKTEALLAKVKAAYRLDAMRRDDYSHEGFDHHLAELKGTTNDQG